MYILRNVSAEVHSGEIMGLMGASGAGKTSLLAILSRQPHLLPKNSKPFGSVKLLLDNDAPPPASLQQDSGPMVEASAATSQRRSQAASTRALLHPISDTNTNTELYSASAPPGPVCVENQLFLHLLSWNMSSKCDVTSTSVIKLAIQQ
jgi:ATPase subunit of ABC transporter with duplicated ATPase domains